MRPSGIALLVLWLARRGLMVRSLATTSYTANSIAWLLIYRLYISAELYPSEPAYYTNRAAALIALTKFRLALEDCQKAQTLQASDPQSKTLLRLARCQIATGSPGPAISTLRLIIEISPSSQPPSLELKRLQQKAEQMQRYLDAVAEAREAQEWAKASLAIDSALNLLEGQGKDVPHEWRSWVVAFKLARRQYDSALETVREALRYEMNSPELMALRGKIMFLMNRTSEAMAPLRQALVLDPEHTDARKMLKRVREYERLKDEGNQAFKRGAWQEAVDKYQDALDAVGSHSEEGGGGIVRALLLSNRATTQMKMGKDRYPAALKDLDESLALWPEGWKALRTRARIRQEMDQFEEALQDFREALRIVENDVNAPEENSRGLEDDVRKAEVLLKRSKEKDYYSKFLPLRCHRPSC